MERKEPTLSGITPDKDEIEARQPRNQRRPERSPTTPPPGGTPPRGGQAPASGPGGLTIIALILALAGLGGSGFLAWKFTQAQQTLGQAEARIADLEQRLDVTYDESSQSVEAIQAKLKWADSEIRKLWGVSYDTNRKNIASNSEQIEKLSSELASVKKETSGAQSAAANLKKSLSEVQSSVTGLKNSVATLDEQRNRLQNLEEKLDQLDDRIAQLRNLSDRVKTNEEAITAIDSYRRSINRDLLAIKQQLGQTSP